MGREIRMVPPNWQHPRDERGNYRPMFDQHFGDRFAQWLADFDRVRSAQLNDIERKCYTSPYPLAEWLNDDGRPPMPAYYRPWRDDEATWVQLWETVSEGTPITPAFATKEELVDHLVRFGDDWGKDGYDRAVAQSFVDVGWAPSMVVRRTASGNEIARGIEIPRAVQRREAERNG